MSDCSTEAMKRKLGYVLRWEINDPNDNMNQTTEVEVNSHRFISEQRYKQLEQVARDLYAALHINEHCSMEFIADEGDCAAFREQLEELGVSLDD